MGKPGRPPDETAPSTNGYMRIPAWLAARSDIPSTAKLLWAALADREGGNGCCWPSLRRLATDLGASTTTVQAAVHRLCSADLLTVETRAVSGGRTSNRYRTRCASETVAQTPPLRVRNCRASETVARQFPGGGVPETDAQTDICASETVTEPIRTKRTKPKREREPVPEPEILEVVQAWNQVAKQHGLATVIGQLKPARRKQIQTMLRDPDRSVAWRDALAKLPSCPFPMGSDGWKADFDWFIRPDGQKRAPIMAIMEGKYDVKPHAAPRTRGTLNRVVDDGTTVWPVGS